MGAKVLKTLWSVTGSLRDGSTSANKFMYYTSYDLSGPGR